MHISLDQALGRQPRLNRVGESLLNIGSGASAAYSLRSLTGGDPKVVNVRRESDNAEQEFTASGVESGALVDFVNADGTQFMAFDGTDDDIDVNAALLPETGDFTLSITFFIVDNPSSDERIFGQGLSSSTGRLNVQVKTNGTAFVFIDGFGNLTTGNSIVAQSINTIVLSRSGTTLSLKLNTGTAVTLTESASTPIAQVNSKIGHAYSGDRFEGVITSLSVASTTWDGTAANATSQGWTVNGSPSTNALNDGFVETWFDQAGSNNATQTTLADQPSIVENGNLLANGITFDGTSDFFLLDNALSGTSSDYSVFSVSNYGSATNGHLLSLEISGSNYVFIYANRNGGAFQESGSSAVGTAFPEGSESLKTIFLKASDAEVFINGSNVDDNLAFTQRASGTVAMGARVNGNQPMLGSLNEIIIYASDQSSKRSDIETNIASHYGISLS